MLIKAPEAARILDVRLARLYELTRQRIIPAVRIGAKQLRYDPDSLREWIQRGGLSQANGNSNGAAHDDSRLRKKDYEP